MELVVRVFGRILGRVRLGEVANHQVRKLRVPVMQCSGQISVGDFCHRGRRTLDRGG